MAQKSKKKNPTINLLPHDLVLAEENFIRVKFIRNLSIAILIIFVASSLTVTILKFVFSSQVSTIEKNFDKAKQDIALLKPKEELIFMLKQRLTRIAELLSQPSKGAENFNAVIGLIPPGVKVTRLNTSNESKITLSGEAENISALRIFFNKLDIPEKNDNKIASAKLETLSQGSDGRLRFELSLVLK